MSTDTWTIESPDGTSIAVHRQGSGEDLVLVHGTACDHRVWARVGRRLRKQGFTCHAVDRRGRGASGDGPDYALEREAEDVATVCEALTERTDGPVGLVGHSLGGIVSLEAATRTDAIDRLVLYEPPIHGRDRPDSEAAEELAELLDDEGPDAVVEAFLAEVGYGGDALALLKANDAIWEATLATADTIPRETRADLEYELDPFQLAQVDVPVLLGLGSESPPMFRDAVARLKANLPDARVEVIEGASHLVLFEAPDAFVETVGAFLAEGYRERS